MDDLEEKIINMVKQQVAVKDDSINLDSKFRDINADSLDIVEIALSVEEEFNIEIPEERAEEIESIRNVVEIVRTLINQK
jgi:acyl carrier protein